MENNTMQDSPNNEVRPPCQRRHANGYAVASLALGAVALVSTFTMTLLPPFLFGGLSVILGLLSRGNDRKLPSFSFAGVVTATGALILNIAILASSFHLVFSNPETAREYWNMVNQTYEEMTGMSFEEFMESYGLSPEQLK